VAKQTVNLGTSANKGDGDPLRTAFDKVNDNFDELYARDINTDFSASVFGDDSTLLVDAVNNVIPSSVVSGTEATNWNTAYGWGDHSVVGYLTSVPAQTFVSLTGKPTTLAGYGITDAATSAQGALAASALQAETITLATLKTEVAASTDFADFQARIAAL
jgi:hypothetical protein